MRDVLPVIGLFAPPANPTTFTSTLTLAMSVDRAIATVTTEFSPLPLTPLIHAVFSQHALDDIHKVLQLEVPPIRAFAVLRADPDNCRPTTVTVLLLVAGAFDACTDDTSVLSAVNDLVNDHRTTESTVTTIDVGPFTLCPDNLDFMLV